MSNSRVISTDFEYYAPQTLDEALECMAGAPATPLAGGTDLLNMMKTEGRKVHTLVYLLGCKELSGITSDAEGIVVGAATSLCDIENHSDIITYYPALKKAVNVIGGTQIRNMATMAGNICNASPGADTPPVLIVLGAEARVCRQTESGTRECRSIPVEQLFTGVKKTILEPEELLTEIRIPWSGENSGQSFRRLARVRLDIAKINCGVYLEREGKTVTSIRICLGSAAPTPVRAKTVEAALEGQNLDTSILQENAGKVVQDIDPITDARSTREYREKMAPLLVQEAVEEAWIDAGGSLS